MNFIKVNPSNKLISIISLGIIFLGIAKAGGSDELPFLIEEVIERKERVSSCLRYSSDRAVPTDLTEEEEETSPQFSLTSNDDVPNLSSSDDEYSSDDEDSSDLTQNSTLRRSGSKHQLSDRGGWINWENLLSFFKPSVEESGRDDSNTPLSSSPNSRDRKRAKTNSDPELKIFDEIISKFLKNDQLKETFSTEMKELEGKFNKCNRKHNLTTSGSFDTERTQELRENYKSLYSNLLYLLVTKKYEKLDDQVKALFLQLPEDQNRSPFFFRTILNALNIRCKNSQEIIDETNNFCDFLSKLIDKGIKPPKEHVTHIFCLMQFLSLPNDCEINDMKLERIRDLYSYHPFPNN